MSESNSDGVSFNYDAPPDFVPVQSYPQLTPRQFRLSLLSLGITSAQVEAEIAQIADPMAREAAMIEWEYAISFRRDHPLVAQIGTTLGKTPEEIDAAWLLATTI